MKNQNPAHLNGERMQRSASDGQRWMDANGSHQKGKPTTKWHFQPTSRRTPELSDPARVTPRLPTRAPRRVRWSDWLGVRRTEQNYEMENRIRQRHRARR